MTKFIINSVRVNIIHLGSTIQPACQVGGLNSNKARPNTDYAL
jgi:hypothetical protein